MSATYCGYPVHPACALLPMMPERAIREMAEDIAEHGQQQPAVIHAGQVLDGRNRLRACEIAGVEPKVVEWTGADDPVRWVMSLNFHRRHLTESQKAVVGARCEELLATAAAEAAPAASAASALEVTSDAVIPFDDDPTSEAQPMSTPSSSPTARELRQQARQTVATLINVKPSAIARGKKLIAAAVPELVAAVQSGAISMSQATRIAGLDLDAQADIVARGDAAVIEEARRISQLRAARRPSLLRALSDIDANCVSWTLESDGNARYLLRAVLPDVAELPPIEVDEASYKSAVLAAWRQLPD